VLPHEAQLLLVPSWVSQPGALVQSTNPALQPVRVQVPLVQDSLAFGRSQAVLQLPQFVSEFSCVSQPLSGLPSQLRQPVSQVGEHA